MIFDHASEAMNAVRDEAFERFASAGFPSKKVERYKYTDIAKLFEPNYGLNLTRLQIPVDPYKAFHCDVPNLSTSPRPSRGCPTMPIPPRELLSHGRHR